MFGGYFFILSLGCASYILATSFYMTRFYGAGWCIFVYFFFIGGNRECGFKLGVNKKVWVLNRQLLWVVMAGGKPWPWSIGGV